MGGFINLKVENKNTLINIIWSDYNKARHAHKRLCMVLSIYSKIQVLPGITSCRLMKYNKPAVDLNGLLKNTYVSLRLRVQN